MTTNPFRIAPLVIRQANKGDERRIVSLFEGRRSTHIHADWRSPLDWVGSKGCVVAERGDDLCGFLCVAADPEPSAWIRGVVANEGDVVGVVGRMMEVVSAELPPTVTSIACLAGEGWLDLVLPNCGFRSFTKIETMELETIGDEYEIDQRFQIRAIEMEEWELVEELDQRAFAHPIWWNSAGQYERASEHAISFDVMECRGGVIGYQLSVRGRPGAHLVRIAVDKAWQGQGAGQALLAHTLRGYAEMGLSSVSLNTQIVNERSRRLYEKFGFVATGKFYTVWLKERPNY